MDPIRPAREHHHRRAGLAEQPLHGAGRHSQRPNRSMGGLEGTHDAHLSFRRRDRQPEPITWRDIQRIKSELCGSEAEAFECFPAESRLIDGSNQRHLWVWRAGNLNAPQLGWYNVRAVLGEALSEADAATVAPLVTVHGGKLSNARQNPFEDGADANLNHQGVIWS